jgi:hypothetical protein
MFTGFDMRQVVGYCSLTCSVYDLAADVNGQENYVTAGSLVAFADI